MEILIAMIVIPMIAILMLYLDHTARYGLDQSSRARSRSILGFLGWCLGLFAVGYLIWAVILQLRNPGQADMNLVLRLIMVGFIAWAGRNTWGYSRREDTHEELSIADHALWEKRHDTFRTSTFALIALPLLVPGTFFALVLFGIVILVISFLGVVWYAQENRLLWTLALAVKHDLPINQEVYGLWRVEQRRPLSHLVLTVLAAIIFWPSLLITIPMAVSRRRFSRRLQSLGRLLDDGVPLGKALLTIPNLLPFEQVGSIHASEIRGTLRQDIPRLALRHTHGLRTFQSSNAVHHTLLYLWFVATWFMYVCGFLMYWIIPKYKEIFNDFGTELPQITQYWIGVSDWFVNYWYAIVPVVLLPIEFIAIIIVAVTQGVFWFPKFMQRMFPRLSTPMFLRAVAGCTDNRTAIENTLGSLLDVSADKAWAGRMYRVQQRLLHGDSVGDSLYGEGVVSRQEADAINHSHKINSLPWMLSTLAEKIEAAWRRRVAWSLEIFQPLAITALSVVVASFSVGMFMAVIKLINDLS